MKAGRAALSTALLVVCIAWGSEDEKRALIPSEFLKDKRKPASNRHRYKAPSENLSLAGTAKDTAIGVTIWRLRPAEATDSGARLLVHEPDNSAAEWIPVRVDSESILREGDRVRFSIESARNGYLYVISREKYSDGTAGQPYLIFPTTRLRDGGDNRTQLGRVIEIPSQTDNPPYFLLRSSKEGHIAEMITILNTLERLADVPVSDRPVKLNIKKFEDWEKLWGKEHGKLELIESVNTTWTPAEKEAGTGSRLLKSGEPQPQRVYYIPQGSIKDPVLITVTLPVLP